MHMEQEFCRELRDPQGRLQGLRLEYPETFNFAYDVVDVMARRCPEQTALVWCSTENQSRRFTFAQMKAGSDRMAQVLQQAGIGRGDRVMLVLKRHYEYWFALLALHKLGAVAIPATHMLTVSDYVYRFREAEVKAVVVTPQDQVPQRILKATEVYGQPIQRFTVRQPVSGFQDLTAAAERSSGVFSRVQTRAEDPMLLYFTSGTTGQPKGVFHDFAYPLAHIVTAKYWQKAREGGLHFSVAETGWAKAAWGKLYGQWLVGSAVMVYDFDHFDPWQLTQIINRYGVTSFCAPPTVYRYLVRKGIPSMPTLEQATTAGEMLAPEVFRAFTAQTGLPLREGYGQTETALLLANFSCREAEEGSMGSPSPLYDIRLLDGEGNPVPEGEIGEVVVAPTDGKRPVGIFSGYLGHEEQYRQAWMGRVYHTGDSAYRDRSGKFWFCGRCDDVIKTGGFRVGPDEVEHILLEYPGVCECSVVGIPDPLRGQAIKAFVSLCDDCTPSPSLALEIKNFCNQKLAEYKWVRMVEFVDRMPKTISGKIRRRALTAPEPLHLGG